MMKNMISITKGFTLLETLASVGILTVVVIGPLSAIVASSSYAHQTKDTMIATYLAEESAELLQNQYDSISIICQKNPGDTLCSPTVNEATPGQTAWRVFKERFDEPASPVENKATCYITKLDGAHGNDKGCSFDYSDIVLATRTEPVRYSGDNEKCKTMVEVTRSTTSYTYHGAPISFEQYQYLFNGGGQGEGEGQITSNPNLAMARSDRKMFVCGGVGEKIAGGTTTIKSYSRNVTIEPMSTFEAGNHGAQYNDDLRVVSNVSYKGVNGVTKNISLVRFIHPRK